tara:strand:+ start:125 stop:691 length:567 start_codon:yes stop_codon:yes gene_type:complete
MDLYEYFSQFHAISKQDFEFLKTSLRERTFQKGEFITLPGQVQKNLYIVKQGVQMSFYETEKHKHVIAFTYPINFCAIPESFTFQAPSSYSLLCLTDSKMDYLSFEALQLLFDKSQNIERLFRKMSEALLAGVINRHIELQSTTIEERFKAFCARSGHLLHLVPHKYIASYLNIEATNFSKLYNSVKI